MRSGEHWSNRQRVQMGSLLVVRLLSDGRQSRTRPIEELARPLTPIRIGVHPLPMHPAQKQKECCQNERRNGASVMNEMPQRMEFDTAMERAYTVLNNRGRTCYQPSRQRSAPETARCTCHAPGTCSCTTHPAIDRNLAFQTHGPTRRGRAKCAVRTS